MDILPLIIIWILLIHSIMSISVINLRITCWYKTNLLSIILIKEIRSPSEKTYLSNSDKVSLGFSEEIRKHSNLLSHVFRTKDFGYVQNYRILDVVTTPKTRGLKNRWYLIHEWYKVRVAIWKTFVIVINPTVIDDIVYSGTFVYKVGDIFK